ncbi:insulinase family protein [Alteromonas lipotrueae]|uniref:insulinase family protein n=1 Tax=Alteromonas lipotrueae TaxID=2803814 RepID=UPI00215C510D|nr:insulinase family protein [Alteromonas lipotrueae]
MINIRYVTHNAQRPEDGSSCSSHISSAGSTRFHNSSGNGTDTDIATNTNKTGNLERRKSLFTGVFVVNTPAHDHSGVSHLAEHMCFRGSLYYPADHELFVANALLPLSINATTYSGCTYFYVQSYNKALFISAIQYLYSGLVNTHYEKSKFEAERSGVLVNELTLLERNIDYLNNMAIRRSDTSTMAYKHAGGFSDSVLKIGFDDLIDYKKRWYDGEHITLLVSGADTDGDEIISLSRQAIAEISARGCNTKSCDAMPFNKAAEAPAFTLKRNTSVPVCLMSRYLTNNHQVKPIENDVSTWWVPQEFTYDLLDVERQIKSRFIALGHFFIDDEVNHAGMIALRFVHNTKTSTQALTDTHKKVVSVLTEFNVEAKPRLFTDAKLPLAVQQLIRDYQQQANSRYSEPHSPLKISPFGDYLNNVHVCRTGKHDANVKSKNADSPINNNWVRTTEGAVELKGNKSVQLAANFTALLSLDHLPALPKLLHKLAALTAQSAQNPAERFQSADNHWVYRVDTQFHHLLIDIMTGASFWQPRTSGECYALGVARFHEHIFIYGAQDRQASLRNFWCKNTLTQNDLNTGVSKSPA